MSLWIYIFNLISSSKLGLSYDIRIREEKALETMNSCTEYPTIMSMESLSLLDVKKQNQLSVKSGITIETQASLAFLEEPDQDLLIENDNSKYNLNEVTSSIADLSEPQFLNDEVFDRIEKFLDEHKLFIVEPSQEVRGKFPALSRQDSMLKTAKSLILTDPSDSRLLTRRLSSSPTKLKATTLPTLSLKNLDEKLLTETNEEEKSNN